MARGNRDSAVRGNRSTTGPGHRRTTERETEVTIKEGMRLLLVFRGVSLVVRYHEGGESDEAFDALRRGAESLAEAVGRLGLSGRAVAESVLDPIEGEVGLMYDARTAGRLMQAFLQCFNKRVRADLADRGAPSVTIVVRDGPSPPEVGARHIPDRGRQPVIATGSDHP
jgi:hypothetical protein